MGPFKRTGAFYRPISESAWAKPGGGLGPHTSLLAHPLGIVTNTDFNERYRRGTILGQNRSPPSAHPSIVININFYA